MYNLLNVKNANKTELHRYKSHEIILTQKWAINSMGWCNKQIRLKNGRIFAYFANSHGDDESILFENINSSFSLLHYSPFLDPYFVTFRICY